MLANLTYGKCLIVGVVIAGLYYLLMYDSGEFYQTELARLQSEISTKERRNASIDKAIVDAERYTQTMKQLGSEMEKVLKAIPESFSPIELLKIVSTTARTVGVNINKLADVSEKSYGQNPNEKEEKVYEPVSVDIDISGTYNQVMTFLSNLTQVDKLLTVEKLQMTLHFERQAETTMPMVKLMSTINGYKHIPPKKPAEGTQ